MQKALLACKQFRMKTRTFSRNQPALFFGALDPWTCYPLPPPPHHTPYRLVYLYSSCLGPKDAFTTPKTLVLTDTTFQKDHMLTKIHSPHILIHSCECLHHGLEGPALQAISILLGQVHLGFISCDVAGIPLHLGCL